MSSMVYVVSSSYDDRLDDGYCKSASYYTLVIMQMVIMRNPLRQMDCINNRREPLRYRDMMLH